MLDFEGVDHRLFFIINGLGGGWITDLFLGYSTFLGDGRVLFPCIALLIWLQPVSTRLKVYILFLLVFIVSGLILNGLKVFIDRPRPLLFFSEAINSGEVQISILFDALYRYSFPSGHSQTAFTASYLILRFLTTPPASLPVRASVYGLASLTALSRVYVGAHFPSDILAGAIAGWLLAYGCATALLKLSYFQPLSTVR